MRLGAVARLVPLLTAVAGSIEAEEPGLGRPELVLQTGHVDGVWAIAFSPDGRWLASGGKDNKVKLWDVAGARELRTLSGGLEWIEAVAFDPRGRWLAAGARNGLLRIWETGSWRELRTLQGSGIRSLAWSPDGRRLASGHKDGLVTLWSTETWTPERTLRGESADSLGVDALAFSSDSRSLAVEALTRVLVFDVASGTARRTLNVPAQALAFSPDGRRLAAGGDREVVIWEGSDTPVVRTGGLPWGVWGIAVSPDGRYLAAGAGKLVKLMDAGTLLEVFSHEAAHQDLIEAVAFHPSGRLLASAGRDSVIRLWEVPSGREVATLSGRAATISALAMSRDGRWLASGSGARFQAGDTAVRAWDVATGIVLHRLVAPGVYGVHQVAFAPDGTRLATDADNESARVFDVASGQELLALNAGKRGNLFALDFSPDGQWLAAARENGDVVMWEARTGAERAVWPGSAHALQFAPDASWLALGEIDRLRLLASRTGDELRRFLPAPRGIVDALAVSPDGSRLAASGLGAPLTLWNTATGAPALTLGGRALALGFAPDGRTLAAAESSVVKLWDVESGRLALELAGHTDEVRAVAFTPDGRIVLSGSQDGSLRLWDAGSGRPLALLALMRGSGDWVAVTPDGLFDGSPDGMRELVAWRFGDQTAPLESFFGEFYAPGLLAEVLAGRELRAPRTIAEVDRRQPKLALALALEGPPTPGARSVTVSVLVEEATAGGVRDVRLFRNGSLVEAWRGEQALVTGRVRLSTKLRLVAGENRLRAYAFNRDNIKSADAELLLNGAASLSRKGTAYVLAIGVNRYANPDYDLRYAVPDATAFAATLREQLSKLGTFAKIEVVPLLDQDATKANVLRAFSRLSGSAQAPGAPAEPAVLAQLQPAEPEDAVFVYYAGHGTASGQDFYLIPHDLGYAAKRAALDRAGLEAILAHGISDRELERAFERVDASRLVLVIDACNSGQALEAEEKRRGPMNSRGLAQLAYEKGMHVLAASQGYQAALEVSQLGHGLLTYALVEDGLKTKAADGAPKDGQVLLREWLDYATRRVPELQQRAMRDAQAQGRELAFVPGEEKKVKLEDRSLQRPRVFYRREAESEPLVVARTGGAP